MVGAAEIPEEVRQDISIYLGPQEKILKAVSSISGKIEAIGEIWLILTTHSIFFHTREFKKEPVIALISRNDLKEIDYFQKQSEISLAFFPKKKQGNVTRLTFPIEKKEELENWCEDVADLINFRMETATGVKVYPKPAQEHSSDASAPSVTKPAAKNDIPDKKIPAQAKHPEKTTLAAAKTLFKTDDVRIVATTGKTGENMSPPGNFNAKYVIIATLVSILVAYIWYSFFRLLSKKAGK
ncbi:MAG: hypothetical protein Kow0029_14800 [Candidatus Rifleibacteriota bacterium]